MAAEQNWKRSCQGAGLCLLAAGLTAFAAGSAGRAVRGAGPPGLAGDARAQAAKAWLEDYFHDAAQRYELFDDEQRTNRLTLVDAPIQHWQQDDDWRGDVFVWTFEGRPEMLGCILASNSQSGVRSVRHEFHSVADHVLPSMKVADVSWTSPREVRRKPLAGALQPARTEPLRLAQMRQLAREFTVTMESDGHPWELRLLPQPLYRYSAPRSGVLDGGIFAFVWTRGTDPEFLLQLECSNDPLNAGWTFAGLRFTTRELRAVRRDEELWHCQLLSEAADPDEPYCSAFATNVTVPAEAPLP